MNITPSINMDDLILWTIKYFMVDSDDKIDFEIINGIKDTNEISKPHHIIIQLLVLIDITIPIVIVV